MTIVNLQIPFESLIAAISSLDLQEKHKLLEFLEEQLLEDEEDLMEQNTDLMLSILRKYIADLGGDLKLVVEFPNRPQVTLSGISEIDI